ncbi:hypothetical protein CBS101457_004202 [Exobasidium rhododendri]|nr:hypothetical protein CBS101457_004202 [Exobasidium rhododendri]
MHDFVSHVLRKYYAQTDWNPYNSYLHLTSSSHSVLDFAIPTGVSLSISASPSPPFLTTHRLRALPILSGALGYIFASIEDDDGNAKSLDIGGDSKEIRFKDVVERFRIIETPWKPTGKEEVFQGGKRVDRRDYLLYGCMHIPSARVDALFTTRLSPTWQLLMTAISMPPRPSRPSSHTHGLSEKSSDPSVSTTASQTASVSGLLPGATNLQINLQRDTGRWFSEYSYSVDDGLLGFRVLHNLGHVGLQNEALNATGSTFPEERGKKEERVDEENALDSVVGGGLQGRFTVGAEVFFSPLEKSAGVSTGVRFTTLPDNTVPLTSGSFTTTNGLIMTDPQSQLTQPPTTITATLNPMMGHLSTAYAARMTRDIVACSRFDFNVYSYDSDLTLGAEYWLHSTSSASSNSSEESSTERIESHLDTSKLRAPLQSAADADRKLQARTDTALSLREGASHSKSLPEKHEKAWSLRDDDDFAGQDLVTGEVPSRNEDLVPGKEGADVVSTTSKSTMSTLGVIKARLSSSGNVALLWEGRLRNCLVSVGIKADVSSSQGMGNFSARKPLRGVGLDIVYFTQNRQEEAVPKRTESVDRFAQA